MARKTKILPFLGKSIHILILLGLTAVAAFAWVFMSGVRDAEIPSSPLAISHKAPVEFYANDGETLLARIHPEDGTREVVSPHRISDSMKEAIVSAEDRTFYDNLGFSPQRIAAAALGHLSGNENAGGASTITQQFVKNALVGDEVSLDRKWEEVLSATKLTASWEKDDIITAYLNTIYFGRGASGIEKAAQAYFGVSAEELNVEQSALIAGAVQSPSRFDPAIDPEGSEQRFWYVIDQMHSNGYLTDAERAEIEMPETIDPTPQNQPFGLDTSKGHIVTMAQNELAEQGFDMDQLFDIGARINTTIDLNVQEVVENTSRSVAENNGVRVSTVSIEPSTGAIRGVYGGDDGMGFNYATNPQMTGSTFKVFTLAAGLENGIGIDTPVSSAPYQSGNTTIGNSGGADCGVCSIADATRQSLNTSFYRLQDMLPNGAESTRDMARQMGVDSPLSESDGSVNRGITLGLYGTSPVEMSAGFATIANDGSRVDNHIVESVYTQNGSLEFQSNHQPVRVISANSANQIDAALEPIAAYSNGNQLSGKTGYMKTGTVQLGDAGGQNRDAWTVGYTDDLSTSVWVGTDDGQPLTDAYGAMVWGAGLPATVWNSVMNQVG